MSARRFGDPNLARQPFENARPVLRLAILLWTLAFAVGGAAAYLAWDVRRATGEQKQALDRLTAEAAAARDRGSRLQAELERADLEEQNVRTGFLNERIAERAFSWNDLFDSLGEVLPRGVRLHDLSPLGFGPPERPGARAKKAGPSSTALVNMQISGVAEDTEALLSFVERLYDHPAFSEPNLAREATQRDEQIEFSLSVGFVPGLAAGSSPLADADGEGEEPKAGTRAPRAGGGATEGGSVGEVAGSTGATRSGATAAGGAPGGLAKGAPAPVVPSGVEAAGASAPAAAAGQERGASSISRYRPGANPPARESTSRFGAAVSGGEETLSGTALRAGSRTTRETPSDGRGGLPPGNPGTGRAPGAPGGGGSPMMPSPLGPFASPPQGIR